MPGLGGSDGSPLVAWPFVVKFLVPPGETPRGLWAPLSPPPAKGPPRNCARMPRASPRSPPRSIIRGKIASISLPLSSSSSISIYLSISLCLMPVALARVAPICPVWPSLFRRRFARSFPCNSFARAFLDNLLIPSVFRVFCSDGREDRVAWSEFGRDGGYFWKKLHSNLNFLVRFHY